MPFTVFTPLELSVQLAARVREARLARGWTQSELAQRAGVSLHTYRLFERTGRVSLERLIAVSSALGRAAEWDSLFHQHAPKSLDEVEGASAKRRRGRRAHGPRSSAM